MTFTKNAWAAVVAVLATLAVVVVMMFVPLNSANATTEDFKTPICHATGQFGNFENGKGEIPKWQIMEENGHGADIANHPYDIIPAFEAGSHGGQEWAAFAGRNMGDYFGTGYTGAEILANGCEIPEGEEPEFVTPLAVTFADECGPDNEVVNIPTVTGVTYSQSEADGVITVTASPANDTYAFPEGTVTVWTHVVNDAACPTETPTVTPETPVVTPEIPVVTSTPEVPTETPVAVPQPEEETPEPDKDKDEPVRNIPRDVQVIACVDGVWTTTVNGEVISEAGSCVVTPENSVPQTFSETGL